MPDVADLGLTTAPDVEDFRALSRSSPWRWRTLHFVHHDDDAHPPGAVEAWTDRVGRLRVLTPDGETHHVGNGGAAPEVDPPRRVDGLVLARTEDWWTRDADPMWGNYGWVAMLDPVELSHHVEVDDVRADVLFDRPVWRATLRPVPGYEPRCGGGCCELLVSEAGRISDDLDDPSQARPQPEGQVYPDAFDVALDVETGVVVRIGHLGGTYGDVAFTNRILDVG